MRCFEDIRGIYRREGPIGRAVMVAMLVSAVIYGGSKPGLRSLPPPNEEVTIANAQFTVAERTLGLACVTNTVAIAGLGFRDSGLANFEATSNAVAKASWLATGVYDDYFTLTPSEDAPIRIGTNEVRRLMVFSHGFVKAMLESGAIISIEPFHVPMSFIAQGKWAECGVTSRCWTASSPASTIIAWDNALLNRDPAQPLSFQMEFLAGGDIVCRYGDSAVIDALTNATISLGSLSSPPWADNSTSITGTIARASSLHFASIAAYGDGTGDADNDGLTDYDELMLHGTSPHEADTDGDGLTDLSEVTDGLNPRDFDSDGDGLADDIDPEPLASCGGAYGQSAAWISATFQDSAEILALGYGSWMQSVIDGTEGDRHYIFTVSVSDVGDSGRALIRVGRQSVIADAPGHYAFLLDKGPVHAFSVSDGTASFGASTPDAQITVMRGRTLGTVVVRAGGVAGNPPWQHYAMSGESHTFGAECVGAVSNVVDDWRWSCAAPDVSIMSPSSQTTAIVWNWTNANENVTWETRSVMVSCRIGDWAATNSVTLHRGSHMEPQTTFSLLLPPAFFATGGADVVVSYNADIPKSGTITVTVADGAEILEEGPPWRWTLSAEDRSLSATRRISATGPSRTAGDIALEAVLDFENDDEDDMTNTVATTAVELREVAIPSAPDSGLVVLAGSSVPMSAVCEPTNAVLDSASCDWFLGRRRGDASYDEWRMVADDEQGVDFNCTMESGGIYRVKVEMALAGETRETFYKIKVRDDLDPPAGHYKVGDHDHIGVASESWQITLRNTALSHVGSTEYAEKSFLEPRHGFIYCSKDNPKCNFFVAHIAEEAGLHIPGMHGRNPLMPYPPLANDWATVQIAIPGWQHLSTNYPQPGWIVGHPSSSGSGHCGIVDYDGFAIAAGQNEVNRRDPRFMDGTCGYNVRNGE